jgi:hypothetical protein
MVEVDQRTRAKIAKDFSRGAPQESKECHKGDCPDDDELPCASTEAPLLSCKPLTAASWANSGLQGKSADLPRTASAIFREDRCRDCQLSVSTARIALRERLVIRAITKTRKHPVALDCEVIAEKSGPPLFL